jgi:hypothetical protein
MSEFIATGMFWDFYGLFGFLTVFILNFFRASAHEVQSFEWSMDPRLSPSDEASMVWPTRSPAGKRTA